MIIGKGCTVYEYTRYAQNNIELRTRGDYEQYLQVRLERKITPDDVNAKYNKKTHTLVIRMPLCDPKEN